MSFNRVSLFMWQGLPRVPLQHALCILCMWRRVFLCMSFTKNKTKKVFVLCWTSQSVLIPFFFCFFYIDTSTIEQRGWAFGIISNSLVVCCNWYKGFKEGGGRVVSTSCYQQSVEHAHPKTLCKNKTQIKQKTWTMRHMQELRFLLNVLLHFC